MTTLTRRVGKALAGKGCKLSFEGETIDMSPGMIGNYQAFPIQIHWPDANGNAGTIIAEQNLVLADAKITQLGLKITGENGSIIYGQIDMQLERKRQTQGPPTIKISSYPVSFVLDHIDRVIDCTERNVSSSFPLKIIHAGPAPPYALEDYHDQVDLGCLGSEYWEYMTACMRFCQNGCTGADPNCVAGGAPGMGYGAGISVECDGTGPEGLAHCACIP